MLSSEPNPQCIISCSMLIGIIVNMSSFWCDVHSLHLLKPVPIVNEGEIEGKCFDETLGIQKNWYEDLQI